MTPLVWTLRASLAGCRVIIDVTAWRETSRCITRVLVGTLPVTAAIATFAGAMLLVQATASLALVGGGPLAGVIVGFGGVRDVFPLMAGVALAARTGATLSSELGTQRVTQQLDALSVMGIDPLRLLVGPRVLATALSGPGCVLLADACGLLGAYLVGSLQLELDRGAIRDTLLSAISPSDLAAGCCKGAVMGWIVGVLATREGLRTEGGPAGVGRATNRAIIRALVGVCIANLVITAILYGRIRGHA